MAIEIKKVKLHDFNVEELACKIIGLDYEEIDADTAQIEEKLLSDLGVDLQQFHEIVSRLVPLANVGESPLTKTIYRGFADTENHMWLVKAEVKEE